MGILDRFADIIKANINDLLDKAEDPSKMIDQYMRDLTESLAEVKNETAGVMAEESRTKRLVESNEAEVKRFDDLARQALKAGNEKDARTFLAEKQETIQKGAAVETAYKSAKANADKMRQMHDKLVDDIETLNARREGVKAKVAVSKTQNMVNDYTAGADKAAGAMGAFDRMEAKADEMLDRSTALEELNQKPVDEAAALEAKYAKMGSDSSVDDELASLKKEMGL